MCWILAVCIFFFFFLVFFFNDTATTEIYTLSLHDALPISARLSGINIDLIIISTYIITGFLVGLAAFILSARLNSAEAVAGMGYELNVIAVVVVGGTSLFGGRGNILGTIIGAMLFGVLQNGLVLLNVSSYIQQIIIGIILILAVTFDKLSNSVRQV